jgi:hypothetical protein
MSYEAAILSAGGDGSVLVESFIIAADDAAAQWYSLLSPGVIHGWDDLKQRILSNFQGFQCPELTESDLFSCKQKDKEPLQNYFRRFVHLRAQAPNVLDVVTINAAIMGLRAGQFHSHLMRERPKTIQRLYEEFEKYCRSDNDFRMCMKSNPSRKSMRKPINRTTGNGPIPEMHRTPILGAFSVWTAKTLRKTPICRLIHRAWYLPRLVPLTPIRGEAAGAEEAEAEVGVEAGVEATTRKENGIVFSTRKTMTTAQTIALTRKDSKQSLRRKERKRREQMP